MLLLGGRKVRVAAGPVPGRERIARRRQGRKPPDPGASYAQKLWITLWKCPPLQPVNPFDKANL
jgi:hypothetical protein